MAPSLQSLSFLLVASILLIDGSCRSLVIQPKSWDYKGHNVAYEEARHEKSSSDTSCKEPILLLSGFGVGSFHQHRLLPRLLDDDDDEGMQNRAVYAMDYLGQGKSWPKDCDDGNSPNEKGLIYSADTWGDQITQFIEQVIMPENANAKVHVVGNSVGGLLACVLAVRRPELIESIILLNATPIWGLNLPFWSGHLPPPAIPRRIGRFLFDRIRDPSTIEKYLDACYANRKAFDEELMNQIRSCTEGKGGHAAFTSILWSPPATFMPVSDTVSLKKAQAFFENIPAIECDVLLLFGRDDPWCKPAFAKKMIRAFRKRTFPHNPACRYIELERVGHCPNHEAPQAVAKILRAWVAATSRDKEHLMLVDGEKEIFHEEWADIVASEKDESEIPLKLADRLATTII